MSGSNDPLRRVITRCWEDEAFKQRLLADPAATLEAEGVRVPAGVTIEVAVDTEDVRTLVIPLAPVAERLADRDVADIAVAGVDRDYVDTDLHQRLFAGDQGSFFIDPQSDPGSLRYYRSRE